MNGAIRKYLYHIEKLHDVVKSRVLAYRYSIINTIVQTLYFSGKILRSVSLFLTIIASQQRIPERSGSER